MHITPSSTAAASVGRRPTWKDLNYHARQRLCNGCGGKGGWFQPPNFLFKASCNHHDFKYWRGGPLSERWKADVQFLCAMLEDALLEGSCWPWARVFLAMNAVIYFAAVRCFGRKYWSLTERTMDDLQAVLYDRTAQDDWDCGCSGGRGTLA